MRSRAFAQFNLVEARDQIAIIAGMSETPATKPPESPFRSQRGDWLIGCAPPLVFVGGLVLWFDKGLRLGSAGEALQAAVWGGAAFVFGCFLWMSSRMLFHGIRSRDKNMVIGNLMLSVALLGAVIVSVENMSGDVAPLGDDEAPMRR